MTQHRPPICWACTRFHGRTTLRPSCDAFPDGIPQMIDFKGFDHRKQFTGDGDMRFESVPNEAIPQVVMYWFKPGW